MAIKLPKKTAEKQKIGGEVEKPMEAEDQQVDTTEQSEDQVETPVVGKATKTTKIGGKDGPENIEAELVPFDFKAGPVHATVEVGLGATVNMGDYNSTRIDVRLTLPCPVDKVNEAYEVALKWADEKMQEMMPE